MPSSTPDRSARSTHWPMMRRSLLALLLALTACSTAPQAQFASSGTERPPPYDRSAFGSPAWARMHGSCDTREVVLERDAGPRAIDTDGDGCRDDGMVYDVYTGMLITPQQAQIDHIYSLDQAWYAGAWRWTPAARRAFSQDQANLMATIGTVNQSKGSRSPESWRPPARSGWCTYQRLWRATAVKYRLEITSKQDAALRELATAC